jgi:cation:H+ antiporter
LLGGLLALLAGADFLVRGSSAIALRLGVSQLVIGLTIVSFGTSMPELLVSFISGVQGKPDLAIGNILGSNIANVLLVLGIAAAIRPLPVQESTVVSEIPFSLTAALLLGFLANAALFSSSQELSISRLDGAILLGFFFLFMLYVYSITHDRLIHRRDEDQLDSIPVVRASIYVAIGVVGLYFGGDWVVRGAVGMAQAWGVDDALIGLTIVAVGTSSPELFASAVAAYRGQADIAVGNVVGSNIFNLLWVLGLTSSVVELPFEVVNNSDIVMVIASSTLIILALVTSGTNTILRTHGVLFVGTYGAYLYYLIQRS